MPQSLSSLFSHIVFSTKYRIPYINKDIEQDLFNYLGGICKGLDCIPIQVGGYRDHVHILCFLSRAIAPMKLVQELKVHSTLWLKNKGGNYEDFSWQRGYAIFSASLERKDQLIKYVENQEKHHTNKTFQEEYISILKKHDLEYNQQFLWE